MSFRVKSPKDTEELFELILSLQGKRFRLGAGLTDLLIELKKQPDEDLTVINLGRLNDDHLKAITPHDDGVAIGALVTAHEVTRANDIVKRYPVLHQAADKLASRQIRQVATVGGNLCTASPAGDIACALVALEAECEIMSAEGTVRVVPVRDFFTGVRETTLNDNEILSRVFIGPNLPDSRLFSDFIKVGTRRSMECSVVSLAYHIQVDKSGVVAKAGVSIGSVAPTIQFADSACEYLTGKSLPELEERHRGEFAEAVLKYASPISDIRASAWYRSEVLFNLSKNILGNITNGQ